MPKGFKKSGAKVKKSGSSYAVTHGTSGKVLSRHGSKKKAQKAAAETRDRNRGSAKRSAKTEKKHGDE